MADTTIPFGPQLPEALDFEDRRRMAEAHMLLEAERHGGVLYPIQVGAIILQHVTSQDEVIPFSKAVNKALARRLGAF